MVNIWNVNKKAQKNKQNVEMIEMKVVKSSKIIMKKYKVQKSRK